MRHARLQLPEITLGIVPALGAMVVPYRRWPDAASIFHGMLRRAETVTADAAHALGVVDALADDTADLIDAAVARVHALAGQVRAPNGGAVRVPGFAPIAPTGTGGQDLSREVLRILERAIEDAAAAPSLGAALEIGYAAFGASACTAAAREGISAFQERRAPDFARTG